MKDPTHDSSSSPSELLYKFKVVLLGEGRVGKTSIVLRFVEGSYIDGQPSTMQASYLEKRVDISSDDKNNSTSISALLSIWDTAGQERFHSLGPMYYRDADGAVLVYDVSSQATFVRAQRWMEELRSMVGNDDDIRIVLVGNKVDVDPGRREVSSEEAEEYAAKVGAKHFLTSAKKNEGLKEVFEGLVRGMVEGNAGVRQRNRYREGAGNGGKRLVLIEDEEDGEEAGAGNAFYSSCCT